MKPLKKGDVVRVIDGQAKGKTGVVHHFRDESISVFVTQNNPYGIAIWFQPNQLKRIGSTVRGAK